MDQYLPYVVSVLCAIISGFTSWRIARKQTKADLEKLEKQHKLDIEKEHEKFEMEKERLEIEHRHQLELAQKEYESKLGTAFTSTVFSEAMKIPEVRQQFSQGVKNGLKQKR